MRIKLPGAGKARTSAIDDYRFKVTVVPGFASRWKIELTDTVVRCGVVQELKRVLRVYATDQHGNRAQIESDEQPTVEPMLTVEGAQLVAHAPKSSQSRETNLRPLSRRLSGADDENGYTLVPIYQLGAKARLDGQASECTLKVHDGETRLEECQTKIKLVAGEPFRICLESNVIDDRDDGDPAAHGTPYTAQVPAKYKLDDLLAKIVDRGGNIVKSANFAASLAVADQSAVTMSRSTVKARAKEGLVRFPATTLTSEGSAKSYTLQVDSRVDGIDVDGAISVLTSRLICTVVLGNGVIDLKHEHAIKTAVCGEPLDVSLKVELVTEDGQPFLPSPESFECEVKRKTESQARPSQKNKTATANLDIVEGGMSVKDGVWMLDDVGSDAQRFVPEQSGMYSITCSYIESRVGMDPNTGMKPVKLDFWVEPAAAVTLMTNSKQNSINANNGTESNGRRLFKGHIKCQDKFNNLAVFPADCSIRAQLVGAADTDRAKWPVLEGAADDGVHKGSVVHPATNKDSGKYQRQGMANIGELRIKEGIGELDGAYELKLDLVSDASGEHCPSVQPLVTKVNFTPDGIRSAEIEAKQGQLEDLYAEKRQIEETRDRAIDTQEKLKENMKSTVKRVKELLGQLQTSGVAWAQQDLDACGQVKSVLTPEICVQIAENAFKHKNELSSERPRPAKVQQRRQSEALRQLGFPLVEAGFVDDEALAHTLAWAASHHMECYVAQDSTKLKEIFTVHDCSCMSEDQLMPYTPKRTKEQQLQGALPLKLPLSHRDRTWPEDRAEPVGCLYCTPMHARSVVHPLACQLNIALRPHYNIDVEGHLTHCVDVAVPTAISCEPDSTATKSRALQRHHLLESIREKPSHGHARRCNRLPQSVCNARRPYRKHLHTRRQRQPVGWYADEEFWPATTAHDEERVWR
eukprot:COSAG06_NODE_2129_length_7531_cov_3.031485_3_plen_921_part_00